MPPPRAPAPGGEAEQIKTRLAAFLRDDLKLELSQEKTLITHARTGAARFLGYEITVHYLELLSSAGLIVGLPKFAGARMRQRGSSPKLLVRNTALMSAFLGLSQPDARRTPEIWGRLVESAVGAHLVDGIPLAGFLSEPAESWL